MSAESPRRALSHRPLPLDAIGYMILGEDGPVSVASAQWGSDTVAVAVEGMCDALQAGRCGDERDRSYKAS